MKCLMLILCLLVIGQGAVAQLVVFDNSHNTPWLHMYDNFKAQLTAWGYTVEVRTTPLTDNGDADVLIILPEDAYTSSGEAYTEPEATWIMDFVDSGKGLLASICINNNYWAMIVEMMDDFGIAEGPGPGNPVLYDQFVSHPLFDGVTALGDDVSPTAGLVVSAPCVAVAGDGVVDLIAVYENGTGSAIWTTHYYMMHNMGLDDHDNLVFLENAFAWLTRGYVANEDSSWGDVKRLFE